MSTSNRRPDVVVYRADTIDVTPTRPEHVLLPPGRRKIHQLIHEITKAIGNPEIAQMIINVEHAVGGDLIKQYGSGSIGKAQHSGSGGIQAS